MNAASEPAAAPDLHGDAVVIDLREPIVRRRYVRGRPNSGEDLRRFQNAHTYPAGEDPDDDPVTVPIPEVVPEPMAAALPDRAVVQRVRLWSVVKVATGLYLCALAVAMIAGVILWNVAERAGWIENWTGFLESIGFIDAAVDGGVLLRASTLAGLIIVATAVMLTVVAASVYNHLGVLVGGLEVHLAPARRRRDR